MINAPPAHASMFSKPEGSFGQFQPAAELVRSCETMIIKKCQDRAIPLFVVAPMNSDSNTLAGAVIHVPVYMEHRMKGLNPNPDDEIFGPLEITVKTAQFFRDFLVYCYKVRDASKDRSSARAAYVYRNDNLEQNFYKFLWFADRLTQTSCINSGDFGKEFKAVQSDAMYELKLKRGDAFKYCYDVFAYLLNFKKTHTNPSGSYDG